MMGDSKETVIERLKTYHKQAEPLIEYYNNKGKPFASDEKDIIDNISNLVLNAMSGV